MNSNRLLCIFRVLLCLLWQCPGSRTIYSGSWCPYKVEKMVPCRVRNGTEPYYGPNICWKSINGSFACTKKILHRPKFVTTYKKIVETRYKCCPGLEGSDCEEECFNCTTFHIIANRVSKIEMKLSILIENGENEKDKKNDLMASQTFLEQDFRHHENLIGGDKSLTFVALNTRISSLMNEFREMERRIEILEREVYRLSTALEERDRDRLQPRHHHHHNNHQSSREVIMEPTPLRQGHLISSTTTTTVKSLASSTVKDHVKMGQHKITLRRLEDNLERGDIASTLNDDYGEELLFENSTEQYVDPLHKDL